MAAYLTTNPPRVRQWYTERNRPLTGCTVLHTAEGVLDTVGPDTGAENVANFIRGRSDYGSYHDLVDSDSAIHLVEYRYGAYHDGTGSNNWALSLSFACAAHHWPQMSAEKRKGFLLQGAKAFLRQQAWRKSVGAPLTELRLITKAESDAGRSGFTYHGYRDPDRRSDPGINPPNLFPFNEFIATIKELQGSGEEDDMANVSQEKFDKLAEQVDELHDLVTQGISGRRKDGALFRVLRAIGEKVGVDVDKVLAAGPLRRG